MSIRKDITVIVGDIGGTNARFAIFDGNKGTLSSIQILQCSAYADFPAMLDDYLGRIQGSMALEKLCLAVAGPVDDDLVSLTNNNISFSKEAIMSRYVLDELTVVNDFTAQAMAVPFLKAFHCQTLRIGTAYENTPILVLGPGTGLGFSALVPTESGWRPLETEGGNVGLTAHSRDEDKLVSWLRERSEYLVAETVLSGRGLETLYTYYVETCQAIATFKTAAEIGDAALAGNKLATQAVFQFLDSLGSYIADSILATGARHAVYLSGGIVPKLSSMIPKSQFYKRAGTRGIYSDYVGKVPIYLITNPYAGLLGAGYCFMSGELSHRKLFLNTPSAY